MSKRKQEINTPLGDGLLSDSDIILHLMQQLRITTARDFASRIGVSRQVIGNILNGSPMSDLVKGAILSKTDVNPNWLSSRGKGEIMTLPRASESDFTQLLKKEIELKNEIINSKNQTINLLNKMLTERELLIDEKNRMIKLLQQSVPRPQIPGMGEINEPRRNYKAKPDTDDSNPPPANP